MFETMAWMHALQFAVDLVLASLAIAALAETFELNARVKKLEEAQKEK